MGQPLLVADGRAFPAREHVSLWVVTESEPLPLAAGSSWLSCPGASHMVVPVTFPVPHGGWIAASEPRNCGCAQTLALVLGRAQSALPCLRPHLEASWEAGLQVLPSCMGLGGKGGQGQVGIRQTLAVLVC